jgi:hypothetical protein
MDPEPANTLATCCRRSSSESSIGQGSESSRAYAPPVSSQTIRRDIQHPRYQGELLIVGRVPRVPSPGETGANVLATVD